MTATATTTDLARDERRDLADLLATLTPEQWDAQTLCERSRVRDVIAHVYSHEELSPPRFAARMLRNRFDNDRTNEVGVGTARRTQQRRAAGLRP